MKRIQAQSAWPLLGMLILFLAAISFRPLLPIDETRYMSVAWEMWLRDGWFAPLTLNFDLYHHKPPLLFWLINTSWSIFGVSRWAALIPVVLTASAGLYLTKALAQRLFQDSGTDFRTLPFMMLGSVPFLMYGTLMMFDVTLMMFVLLALLALVLYADQKKLIYLLAMSMAMGLGVLTKGPVAWLYVIFPVLLAPVWLEEKRNWWGWYGSHALAFLLSAVPVLLWLIPVLKASNPDFAFWLIWEQTAGRITGHMGNAHTRPVYFYLPLLPVLFLPWVFFPSFWSKAVKLKEAVKTNRGVRFVMCWIVPVFLAFSLIGGKQPHYLVPLLPGVLMVMAYVMDMSFSRVVKVSAAMVIVFVLAQGIAAQTVFKRYDLQPIADYVAAHHDTDWAFARKYQGEVNFLGRLKKPVKSEQISEIDEWLKAHPEGRAIIRYHKPEEVAVFEKIMSIPYRSKNIGIFAHQEH